MNSLFLLLYRARIPKPHLLIYICLPLRNGVPLPSWMIDNITSCYAVLSIRNKTQYSQMR